ncbi:hypothetical protein C8R47DRAFT_580940 [Mycena vitilis]|nr:hypothetical protein C8R47DRAFT_580940 [Mycena vitilis]
MTLYMTLDNTIIFLPPLPYPTPLLFFGPYVFKIPSLLPTPRPLCRRTVVLSKAYTFVLTIYSVISSAVRIISFRPADTMLFLRKRSSLYTKEPDDDTWAVDCGSTDHPTI